MNCEGSEGEGDSPPAVDRADVGNRREREEGKGTGHSRGTGYAKGTMRCARGWQERSCCMADVILT